MSTEQLIAKASDPAFYSRVGFLALKVAQQVSTENTTVDYYLARQAYAATILRGSDNLILLSMHVIASNDTIQTTITDDNEPPDNDIEFALSSIWTSRALAFEGAA